MTKHRAESVCLTYEKLNVWGAELVHRKHLALANSLEEDFISEQ